MRIFIFVSNQRLKKKPISKFNPPTPKQPLFLFANKCIPSLHKKNGGNYGPWD